MQIDIVNNHSFMITKFHGTVLTALLQVFEFCGCTKIYIHLYCVATYFREELNFANSQILCASRKLFAVKI